MAFVKSIKLDANKGQVTRNISKSNAYWLHFNWKSFGLHEEQQFIVNQFNIIMSISTSHKTLSLHKPF